MDVSALPMRMPRLRPTDAMSSRIMLERMSEKTAMGASLMRNVMTMVTMRSISLTRARRGEREDGPEVSAGLGPVAGQVYAYP